MSQKCQKLGVFLHFATHSKNVMADFIHILHILKATA